MKTKPNVLLMMCDQLNASVLSCYGGPVPTPNIDRIASRGVLFRGANCPTPFCSPSRASMINGLYPHTHGIVHNVNWNEYSPASPGKTEEGIKADDTTTEKLLYESGYETCHYGKWHLMDERLPYYSDMFGENHGYVQNMSSVFEETRKRPRDTWMKWYNWSMPVQVSEPMKKAVEALGDRWQGKTFAEFVTKMGRLELPLEQNFDVQVADHTIECLKRQREAPFMITCSFNYPHDPNVVPSPYYDMFPPDEIQLPANFDFREQRFERDWSREIVAGLGEAGTREFLRLYYAAVKLIDDQVGRIIDTLEATGQAENTIIVFTADHGDMAGGHGMVWKSTASFYDETVRIPLILSYPNHVRPGETDLAAGLTDLMPTLLDFLEYPVPDGIQGHSLAPYLIGESDPAEAPPYTFCERVQPNKEHNRKVAPGTSASFMIRGKGWKYIVFPDKEEFLYDLKNDPGETENLAGNRSFHDVKVELISELDAWLTSTEYPGHE